MRVRPPGRVEWPTVAVAVAVHAGWVGVTLGWHALPLPVAVALLALVVAWHSSLQHELIHGHPFRDRRWNHALGSLPMGLAVAYGDYLDSHLAHHRDERLTDPFDDPESWYLTPARWHELGPVGRAVARANRTLAGRLVLGPAIGLAAYARTLLPSRLRGDRRRRRHLLHHLAGVTVALVWIVVVCRVPVWAYVLAAVQLARSIGLVRSFAEHRWVPDPASRSAVVRAGRFWSLLFLHNNLHHTHHARPGAPWYRLPVLADALGSDAAAAEGAGRYAGYGVLARRYLFRPFDTVVHPAAAKITV